MECHLCKKGKMVKVISEIKQDGISFEALKCANCGEEIVNMIQLKVLAQKYRDLRQAKDITFAKWGNSIALRIPSDIAEEFNIKSGKHGILTKDKDGLRIKVK